MKSNSKYEENNIDYMSDDNHEYYSDNEYTDDYADQEYYSNEDYGDSEYDDNEYDEDDYPEDEQSKREKWRLVYGVSDFIAVLIGCVVILMLVGVIVSLVSWVMQDIYNSFTLLQL